MDVGVTGLALLAFLGAGHTPLSKEEFPDLANPGRSYCFGEVVKKGLDWFVRRQDLEGCLADRSQERYMYGHAIGTMALCEAWARTKAEFLREPARRAVDFLLQAQNPGKGWRYNKRSGDNDTSVTTWCVMALRAAEIAGITFEKTAYEGALAWYNEVTCDVSYRVGYAHKSTTSGGILLEDAAFNFHETLSACACLGRCIIKPDKKDPALKALNFLEEDLPRWEKYRIDYCYWFFGTAALCVYEGPKGERWMRWRKALREALVPHQLESGGCLRGSWDDVDRWSTFKVGRVYATAINLLTLEFAGDEPGILKIKP